MSSESKPKDSSDIGPSHEPKLIPELPEREPEPASEVEPLLELEPKPPSEDVKKVLDIIPESDLDHWGNSVPNGEYQVGLLHWSSEKPFEMEIQKIADKTKIEGWLEETDGKEEESTNA